MSPYPSSPRPGRRRHHDRAGRRRPGRSVLVGAADAQSGWTRRRAAEASRSTLRFSELPAEAGAPLLSLPLVIANTATVADTLTGLKASDDAGEIPLTVKDDPATGPGLVAPLAGRAAPRKGDRWSCVTVPRSTTPRPSAARARPTPCAPKAAGSRASGNTFILLPEEQDRPQDQPAVGPERPCPRARPRPPASARATSPCRTGPPTNWPRPCSWPGR